METTQEIIKPDQNIVVLSARATEVAHAIHTNLGALQLNTFDLPRIKIPVGGGTSWTVQTLEGEVQTPIIIGVIANQRDVRAYWDKPYGDGEAGPPSCQSLDMVMGVGVPGGECRICPKNIFGTKPLPGGGLGKGKACGEAKQLLIYRDSYIPELLQLPPTSLKAARQYLLNLGGHMVPYYGVITAITLTKVKNSGGIPYSEARFRSIRKLTADELTQMKELKELLDGYMQSVPIDIEAVSEPIEATAETGEQ